MIYFLNFGHASTPLEGQEEVRRLDLSVQNLPDPSDPAGVLEAARTLVRSAGEFLREARTDNHSVVVALPGSSLVAAALIGLLAGMLGFMPSVVVGTKTSEGFVYRLSRKLVLPDVRDAGRALRPDLNL